MTYPSSLYEKLAKINPLDKPDGTSVYMLQYRPRPDRIRMCTDSFMRYLQDDLPKNHEELQDTLYVFGRVLDGILEQLLHNLTDIKSDEQMLKLAPVTIVPKQQQIDKEE